MSLPGVTAACSEVCVLLTTGASPLSPGMGHPQGDASSPVTWD